MPAPTFEEMMDSATKSKPSSSADSNDPEGLTATKSRPSSPAVSDHSVGLNEAEFQALADSLEETTDPACDKQRSQSPSSSHRAPERRASRCHFFLGASNISKHLNHKFLVLSQKLIFSKPITRGSSLGGTEQAPHPTVPVRKCAADRASQHPTGEINEWGDNLVQPGQRDRYDLTEGEEEEE